MGEMTRGRSSTYGQRDNLGQALQTSYFQELKPSCMLGSINQQIYSAFMATP